MIIKSKTVKKQQTYVNYKIKIYSVEHITKKTTSKKITSSFDIKNYQNLSMESIITRKKYSVGKATKQGLKLHNEDIQYITKKKKPTTNKKSHHNLGQPINIYSETESRKKNG